MTDKTIRIATRGSRLALWQANYVADLLKAKGYAAALTIIKTKGDIVQDRFLHEIGGKGLFVKELEASLERRETDIAVHSLKDLPARTPKPFCLAAVLKRHSSRDVLIMRHELAGRTGGLKDGALVTSEELASWGDVTLATASLRRQSLIKHVAPKAKLAPVRGNVDTRIEKLKTGSWDGLILASAALERLGLYEMPAREIDPVWFVPAPAQGALAIESLEDNAFRPIIAELTDAPTMAHVTMEREALAVMGGDCTMPFGCHIEYDATSGETIARAVVLNADGAAARTELRMAGTFREWESASMVQMIVKSLFDAGAEKILRDLLIAVPDLGKL